jgi:hypothetical protein
MQALPACRASAAAGKHWHTLQALPAYTAGAAASERRHTLRAAHGAGGQPLHRHERTPLLLIGADPAVLPLCQGCTRAPLRQDPAPRARPPRQAACAPASARARARRPAALPRCPCARRMHSEPSAPAPAQAREKVHACSPRLGSRQRRKPSSGVHSSVQRLWAWSSGRAWAPPAPPPRLPPRRPAAAARPQAARRTRPARSRRRSRRVRRPPGARPAATVRTRAACGSSPAPPGTASSAARACALSGGLAAQGHRTLRA